MSANALRHNAFIYESDDEYVSRSAAFLSAGLDGGEAAIVVASRTRLAAMREEMGAAADRVTFIDAGGVYVRPAHTIAAYHSTLLAHLRTAPSIRAIAELHHGPTEAERREWSAYEAITNHAYPHVPAWIVCAYSAPETPDRMLDDVWRTHDTVLTDDWRQSPRFEDPATVVRSLTPPAEPLEGLRSLGLPKDSEGVRERLARALGETKVPDRGVVDLLLAATEVANNAYEHAGGLADLRAGVVDGRFVCEISDDGPGLDDPLAGYIVPGTDQTRGRGLWIARQLTWRLELLPRSPGLTVRLWL